MRRSPSRRFRARPALEILEDRLAPAIFTVTTTADDNNGATNGVSLREAILSANSNPGADTIDFDIPGDPTAVQTISPTSALPTITGPTTIDGYTQGDARPNTLAVGNDAVLLIELNGAGVASGPGLRFNGGGNTVSGLVVNRFTGNALVFVTAGGNRIEGNFIGTNAAGTADLGNAGAGIAVGDASNNTIGGTSVAARNVLSGNATGITLSGSGATGNVIQGNYIGTNAAGTVAIGNDVTGIFVTNGASGNTIGGTAAGAGNLISGSAHNGVQLDGNSNNNIVQGNYLGTDASGMLPLGNNIGVAISKGSTGNLIGGASDAARNIISGNISFGVLITKDSAFGGTTGPTKNLVQGNYIGVAADGTSALGNLGHGFGIFEGSFDNTVIGNRVQNNAGDGVRIFVGAHDNTIGGPTEADRNVIAGNGGIGVHITTDSYGNLVQNNYIGADANGGALGNGVNGQGVGIFNNSDNNSIVDNLILANSRSGISVAPADSTGNTFYRNRIIGNGWVPIDLTVFFDANQVTLNDLGDGDTGANNYQNFPFIAGVNMLGPDTFISGSLYSTPSTTFRLEFFAADTLSPSGHRQAQYVLGTLDVTTDATGLATFFFEYTGSLPGPIVTATATNLTTGDTSELFNPSKPTNITLSNQTLQENAGANALVGNLTTADPDLGDAHFYTLVSGAGDTDNASFTIVGNQLRAVNSLYYEDGATRSVRIRTTDLHGLTFEKSFTITVLNLVDLSGRVFDDKDNDGLFDPGDGETGIGGVAVHLFNQISGDLIATRTTAADGTYYFDVKLGTGTYRLVAEQPAAFLDGRETAGNLGGAVDNSQDSSVIGDIVVGEPGTTADAVDYLFARIRPSQALGLVWSDFNNDGEVNFGEAAIAGTTIELTGLDDRGNAVNFSVTTDPNGIYAFLGLRPSNGAGYTLHELQPSGYLDGLDSLGTANGVMVGDASVNDTFSAVVLPRPSSAAENYNFGERPSADGSVQGGQTATIGFWQNNNGQNLIKALNGGSTSTQLSAWLAATFPNMYGASAGANNLTGNTNAQVAAFYKTLFARNAQSAAGGGPAKLDAQVLATAFAVYVTNQSLAGMTATAYGFLVTANGVGTRTFNVGSNGAAFGVANNTEVSVLDLLLAVNSRSRNGLLYDLDSDGDATDSLETSFRTMANYVFSAINEAGDI